ncbi:uncharacterized protein L3040_005904 [Drepanopeziza brunnea f. sp. 'multigermtubi']|uniref:uncharacterized protein n=1 Tax=Drepanopeziza brunnea f. sp. 'multigermtubi' TaxID=698441 RepID=UPI002397B345|nr:hypothetical protein L3040_005904 [Drepanopeziza brunnea f. sp. 'multigermtubi']
MLKPILHQLWDPHLQQPSSSQPSCPSSVASKPQEHVDGRVSSSTALQPLTLGSSTKILPLLGPPVPYPSRPPHPRSASSVDQQHPPLLDLATASTTRVSVCPDTQSP